MRDRLSTWPRPSRPAENPRLKQSVQYVLLSGPLRIVLTPGEMIIGRGEGCDISIDDMLVSRRHARLFVSQRALLVEDLGSANGVLVNEAPTSGPTPLGDGDRLMIGSRELLVAVRDHDDRNTQSTEPPAPARAQVLWIPEAPLYPESGGLAHGGDTLRQEAVVTMARVADRMLTMGRGDAAVRVVGDHLRSVLAAAQEGEAVPTDLRDVVAQTGAKLAKATGAVEWLDLVVELHLATRQLMSERAITALETVELPLDAGLLGRYLGVLGETASRQSPAELGIARRVGRLPRR